MKKELESILISAVFEHEDDTERFGISALQQAGEILSKSGTFQDVPENVYISMDVFKKAEDKAGSPVGLAKDIATNYGKDNEKDIVFFEKKGILLYDGIHASAFGRMNYIYRSKGIPP